MATEDDLEKQYDDVRRMFRNAGKDQGTRLYVAPTEAAVIISFTEKAQALRSTPELQRSKFLYNLNHDLVPIFQGSKDLLVRFSIDLESWEALSHVEDEIHRLNIETDFNGPENRTVSRVKQWYDRLVSLQHATSSRDPARQNPPSLALVAPVGQMENLLGNPYITSVVVTHVELRGANLFAGDSIWRKLTIFSVQ